ncbi:PREDICTED: putative F-box protein At1g58090 [Camelina sativa]|uniref:F-box protein At1g58090 n=1 Tax=Camelina sativa TaxID=90675 RepID=A0ABM0ZBY1_CAMSA|nr:PREDICTED: putative F-box protein At1g58090 [Camelina sativa]
MVARKLPLMAVRNLPPELEEEILVRVPPRSLVRFRSVCKGWNTLFNDKRFVDRNFACARPEILLKTLSHLYPISVDLNKDDPTIKISDLCFDLRGRRYDLEGTCDGYLLLSDSDNGALVRNPLFNQTEWIDPDKCPPYSSRQSMGYDGSNTKKSYKIIGSYEYIKTRTQKFDEVITKFAVFKFATNAWDVTYHTSQRYREEEKIVDECNCTVSLNGNLYWTAYTSKSYFIRMFDFSKEVVQTFCILPFKGTHSNSHTRGLAIYKGDRLSVLQQCIGGREVKIWVTDKKIGNGDDVVWINFMTISIPKFPMVCNNISSSYFVDNNVYGKTFFTCFLPQKPKQAWVYIVRGDLCKKIKIDEVAYMQLKSCVYVPSLITISREALAEGTEPKRNVFNV